MFIRFVVSERHAKSDQAQGIFGALSVLEQEGELQPHEKLWLGELESWFNKHLRVPSRFTWSSRPNAPARAITWLKLSAVEHVSRMRELVAFLEHKEVMVEELRTEKPGYIVYEDEHQVVAMPFPRETF